MEELNWRRTEEATEEEMGSIVESRGKMENWLYGEKHEQRPEIQKIVDQMNYKPKKTGSRVEERCLKKQEEIAREINNIKDDPHLKEMLEIDNIINGQFDTFFDTMYPDLEEEDIFFDRENHKNIIRDRWNSLRIQKPESLKRSIETLFKQGSIRVPITTLLDRIRGHVLEVDILERKIKTRIDNGEEIDWSEYSKMISKEYFMVDTKQKYFHAPHFMKMLRDNQDTIMIYLNKNDPYLNHIEEWYDTLFQKYTTDYIIIIDRLNNLKHLKRQKLIQQAERCYAHIFNGSDTKPLEELIKNAIQYDKKGVYTKPQHTEEVEPKPFHEPYTKKEHEKWEANYNKKPMPKLVVVKDPENEMDYVESHDNKISLPTTTCNTCNKTLGGWLRRAKPLKADKEKPICNDCSHIKIEDLKKMCKTCNRSAYRTGDKITERYVTPRLTAEEKKEQQNKLENGCERCSPLSKQELSRIPCPKCQRMWKQLGTDLGRWVLSEKKIKPAIIEPIDDKKYPLEKGCNECEDLTFEELKTPCKKCRRYLCFKTCMTCSVDKNKEKKTCDACGTLIAIDNKNHIKECIPMKFGSGNEKVVCNICENSFHPRYFKIHKCVVTDDNNNLIHCYECANEIKKGNLSACSHRLTGKKRVRDPNPITNETCIFCKKIVKKRNMYHHKLKCKSLRYYISIMSNIGQNIIFKKAINVVKTKRVIRMIRKKINSHFKDDDRTSTRLFITSNMINKAKMNDEINTYIMDYLKLQKRSIETTEKLTVEEYMARKEEGKAVIKGLFKAVDEDYERNLVKVKQYMKGPEQYIRSEVSRLADALRKFFYKAPENADEYTKMTAATDSEAAYDIENHTTTDKKFLMFFNAHPLVIKLRRSIESVIRYKHNEFMVSRANEATQEREQDLNKILKQKDKYIKSYRTYENLIRDEKININNIARLRLLYKNKKGKLEQLTHEIENKHSNIRDYQASIKNIKNNIKKCNTFINDEIENTHNNKFDYEVLVKDKEKIVGEEYLRVSKLITLSYKKHKPEVEHQINKLTEVLNEMDHETETRSKTTLSNYINCFRKGDFEGLSVFENNTNTHQIKKNLNKYFSKSYKYD